MNDAWEHRSTGMKCHTCMWFLLKKPGIANQSNDERGGLGRCRRNAPSMNGFPAVFEADWCGDHKLDETKI
jgi:hypothetical protein